MAEHSGSDDATLVAAIRGGDTAAWGDVFDHHRDAVWRTALAITRRHSDAEDVVSATFLRAVETIDQLQNPDRLRPWLMSIARRRALDLVRPNRQHELPSEAVGLYEPAADDGDALSGLHRDDQRALVADALEGLEPRDRIALEFAEAQDLRGDDLAEALDISRDNAYALVHNARDRFAAAVSSLLVSRHGREECAELDGLLGDWDGALTPRLRKRVNRHLKDCEVCDATQKRKVTPAALLAAAPVGLTATALGNARDEVLASAAGTATGEAGSATAVAAVSTKAAGTSLVGMIATTVIAGGLAIAVVFGVLSTGGSSESEARTTPSSEATTGPAEPVASAVPTSAATAVGAAAQPPTDPPPSSEATASTEPPPNPCAAVAELRAYGAAGPSAPSGAGFAAYLTGVKDRLDAVVSAFATDASAALVEYQTAYDLLVASGVDDPASIPNGPALAALKDQVESELTAVCS